MGVHLPPLILLHFLVMDTGLRRYDAKNGSPVLICVTATKYR